MASVLILSSFVAASRVGGSAQALALARLGIEPILIPTVLFGRHPGHGPPGGGPVAAQTLEAMLRAVEAQGVFARLDVVISGHFSAVDQVAVAAQAIDRVRAAGPSARIIVDPIMGDDGKGLYVAEAVARAIAADLVPRADLLAPNAWELARLTGRPVGDAGGAVGAARSLGRPVLVSSIRSGSEIGAAYVGAEQAWLAAHDTAVSAPNGTGDLLTVLFAAALMGDMRMPKALHVALSGVAQAVAAADGAAELPISAFPVRLSVSPGVRLEVLDD